MPETEDPHGFVDVRSLSPNIKVKLPYATPRNFLGRAVYAPDTKCLLRRTAALRLARVQASLEKQGLGLLVWDCWRPLSIQKEMWKTKPDPKYVADPRRGSKHNRGMAVDLTLTDKLGNSLFMPTSFDEFSDRARSDYQGGTAQQRNNRDKLSQEMQAQGFTPYAGEWWHFDAIGWKSYPVK
jgi:D-alanyl-D-alanine dipeptidase